VAGAEGARTALTSDRSRTSTAILVRRSVLEFQHRARLKNLPAAIA
jgi:hypothetical protein